MIMNYKRMSAKEKYYNYAEKCSDAFIRFRSRAVWIDEGEKNPFYFLILGEKTQQRSNNTTNKVQNENQIKHTDNTCIIDCLISFCDIY